MLDQIEDAGIHGVEPVGQDFTPWNLDFALFVSLKRDLPEYVWQAFSAAPYIIADLSASIGGKDFAMRRVIARPDEKSAPLSAAEETLA